MVEIDDENGEVCTGCRRLFDASKAENWPVSFGVVDSARAEQIRVRLLRSPLLGSQDTLGAGLLLDAGALLPRPSGVTPVSLRLSMECFGVVADFSSDQACDPKTHALAPLAVATSEPPLTVAGWAPAQPTACATVQPEGMSCVPGGAFLLGDATRVALADLGEAAAPEHLVVLPAFHLDREELRVGQLRALLVDHPELSPPLTQQPANAGLAEFCTFDPSGANDAMPVNCLTWYQAEAYCAARGARLPTEAEWEFAAVNRASETLYPWGESEDLCAIAIVERGPVSPSACRITPSGTLDPGPIAAGGPLDFTELGVHDLGGSLLEWVQDSSDSYDGECWAQPGALVDPLCTNSGGGRVVRGGGFANLGSDARGTRRRSAAQNAVSGALGVRCAAD